MLRTKGKSKFCGAIDVLFIVECIANMAWLTLKFFAQSVLKLVHPVDQGFDALTSCKSLWTQISVAQ